MAKAHAWCNNHLDVLDAQFQDFIGCSAGEVNIHLRQRYENKFLRNFVDQRDAQALLQVNQHLKINKDLEKGLLQPRFFRS